MEKLNTLNDIDLCDNLVYEKIKNKKRSDSDLSSNTETSSNMSEALTDSDSEESDSDQKMMNYQMIVLKKQKIVTIQLLVVPIAIYLNILVQ